MAETTYHAGSLVGSQTFSERVRRAGRLMETAGLDAVLLTKPQNMTYLVGDGRLCAFAIVSKAGATYFGVPKTDIEDVKKTCASDHILGFISISDARYSIALVQPSTDVS